MAPSNDPQVALLCAYDGTQCNRLVESSQATIAADRQSQQIQIGDLVMAAHPFHIHAAGVAQTDVIWPELMIEFSADSRQLSANPCQTERPNASVGGKVQDPNHRIFHHGTGGDTKIGCLEQSVGGGRVQMRIVKQRNPDVDVEQHPHQTSSCDIRSRTWSGVMISSRCGASA